jgi:hypothetical protein
MLRSRTFGNGIAVGIAVADRLSGLPGSSERDDCHIGQVSPQVERRRTRYAVGLVCLPRSASRTMYTSR